MRPQLSPLEGCVVYATEATVRKRLMSNSVPGVRVPPAQYPRTHLKKLLSCCSRNLRHGVCLALSLATVVCTMRMRNPLKHAHNAHPELPAWRKTEDGAPEAPCPLVLRSVGLILHRLTCIIRGPLYLVTYGGNLKV